MRRLLCTLAVATVITMMLCAILSLALHREFQREDLARRTADIEDATPVEHESSAVSDDKSIDLYGNDVTDAVAKYSLDATGTLYEVHSPQTEIPKLGSPKS